MSLNKLRWLRTIFDAWRIDTHSSYKQKQIELEPTYYLERKTQVIDEWDSLIGNLRAYIDQLNNEIKIEVTAKNELVKVYEATINGSVQKFQKENDFVVNQIGQYRQETGFDDTFARNNSMVNKQDTFGKQKFKKTSQYIGKGDSQYVPITTDIGYLSLLKEQQDPEEDEKEFDRE